jgi:hypothetical protein
MRLPLSGLGKQDDHVNFKEHTGRLFPNQDGRWACEDETKFIYLERVF